MQNKIKSKNRRERQNRSLSWLGVKHFKKKWRS